jgi:hypothetical protein
MELSFAAIGEGLRPIALTYIRTYLWSASPLGGVAAGYLGRGPGAQALLATLASFATVAALMGAYLLKLDAPAGRRGEHVVG